MKKYLFHFIFLWGVISFSHAQEHPLAHVKSEIMALSEQEINAFRSGDCQTMIDFLADDVSFYANGNKAPGKEMIFGFCKRIARPFETPSKLETEYFPISEHSAYVVRIMEFSKDDNVYKKEIVTKIWVKGESGWKIVHLHSTIKEL